MPASPPAADALLAALPDGVLAVDGRWSITFANAAAARILGGERQDAGDPDALIGSSLFTRLAGLEGSPAGGACRRAMTERVEAHAVLDQGPAHAHGHGAHAHCSHGRRTRLQIHALPLRSDELLLCLRQSEGEAERPPEPATGEPQRDWKNRYEAVIRASHHLLYDWDTSTRSVVYGGEHQSLLGYSFAEMGNTLDAWIEKIHPEDRARFEQQAVAVIASRDPLHLEYRVRHRDGHYLHVDTDGHFVEDEGGRTGRMVGLVRNVTAQRAAEALQRRQARQALLIGEVGEALTHTDSLRPMLQRCAEAIVTHLTAALSRIWTLNPAAQALELEASAGLLGVADGADTLIPLDATAGWSLIGHIVRQGLPHLTNDVEGDTHIDDPAWAQREGLTAFAGYPLMLEGRVIGALAVYAREPLSTDTLDALASVTDAIALGIERKRADRALQKSEQRYQLAVRATKDAIWDRDLLTNHVTWNEGLCELSGYSPGEVSPDAAWWVAGIHPEDRERIVSGIREALDAGRHDWEGEYRFRKRDGSYALVADRGFISKDARGFPVRMVGAMRDITRKRRAEERVRLLAEAGAVLSASLDYGRTLEQVARLAVPVLADWCDVTVVAHDGEPGALRRVAFCHADPEKQPLGLLLQERYPLDANAPQGIARVVRTAQMEQEQHLTDDGLAALARDSEHLRILRSLGVSSYIILPLSARGRVLGALRLVYATPERTYSTDDILTIEELARRAALSIDNAMLYKELQAGEQRFRALVENLPALAWSARPDGYIDYYNRRWFEYTGTTLEEVAGWGWTVVHDPQLVDEVVERMRYSFSTGTAFEMEFPLRGADGVFRWFLTRMRPLHDAEGRIVRWFGTNTNIDEQRQQAAELARSNRELDQFAYVASHDLKAPLRGIANLSQWIEEDLAERMTDESRAQMRLLRGRVSRLEGLIEGILQYGRAGRMRHKQQQIHVESLVHEVIELLSPRQCAPDAVIEIQPDLPTLMSEKVPLQQVFMNLIGNALKHCRKSDPRIEIGARELGPRWEFYVKDDGPGIDPAFHERIWGIFQTLEPRDRVESTGIGLAVVRKIVEGKGGRSWVESQLGQGAIFRFTWPRFEGGTA